MEIATLSLYIHRRLWDAYKELCTTFFFFKEWPSLQIIKVKAQRGDKDSALWDPNQIYSETEVRT